MTGLWTLLKVMTVMAPCYPSLGCTTPAAPAISSGRVEHLSYDVCQQMGQQFNLHETTDMYEANRDLNTTVQAACVPDGQADAVLATYVAKMGGVQ